MADLIHLLPDPIANQIAAGEVVQRPASVVKELLENAVDAGSTNILVNIQESGKQLIQVIDDGAGMSDTDARMSFERHATSKISKSDDLFHIRTFGFRGEALASIAAVAQIEMKTAVSETDLGTRICIEASEVKLQEPVQFKKGTSVSVKNLFYNVPARRNFLKSNTVEFKHILDEFYRVSIANYSIAFRFIHNEHEQFNLKPGNLSQRLVNLFGNNYREQLVVVEEDANEIKVHGYVGKPNFAKKTRGEQFFFMNNRFIKSGYLNHAVMNAFEGLLTEGSYPFFSLFIELPTEKVDINVHPTKTEVKFEDERTIYGVVRAAVKQALGTFGVVPSLDFEMDVNFNFGQRPAGGSGTRERSYSNFKTIDAREKTNIEQWERLYQVYNQPKAKQQTDDGLTLTFSSSANERHDTGEQEVQRASKETIFQIHDRYIFSSVKSGVMIIDQELAHERILYERYLNADEGKAVPSQQLLFPVAIDLTPMDFELLADIKNELEKIGFKIEAFGSNAIKLTGAPVDFAGNNEKELFESLLEQFKFNQSNLKLNVRENLVRSLAKRAGINPGKRLEKEELHSLIDGLFACKNPNYSPDGRPTFYILGLPKIEEEFK
jgi:DNA mismatch repair protein MutL